MLGSGVGTEESETVLCLNNLSHAPQAGTVSLPGTPGCDLVDLFGGTGFPAIPEDGELKVTMGSRDFFWLRVNITPLPAQG